jgi:hypothetical protein
MTKDEALKMENQALESENDCECGESRVHVRKLTEALKNLIEIVEALEAEQVCQAQKPYGYVVEFDGTANPPEFYFEKDKAQNEANHCLVGAKVKPLYTKEQP